MCCFYSFKKVQDWLYVEHYLLQQTMRSMLFCVTQNNNSSLGNTHGTATVEGGVETGINGNVESTQIEPLVFNKQKS